MNLNKLFKKFLALLMLIALTEMPVEAASRHKKPSVSRTKKVRTHRAKRTSRVRKSHAPRVRRANARLRRAGAFRHSRGLTARQIAVAARAEAARVAAVQAEAARVAAVQAEAARVAAIRQRQADPVRLAAVRQQLQNLSQQPLNIQNNHRFIPGQPAAIFYPTCDIGHGVGEKARSDIYQALNVPTAPVFHPYHPTDGLGMAQNQFSEPAFTLNVKLPGYDPDLLQPAMRALVGDIEPGDIEMGLNVQHIECFNTPAPLQFKPQYGIEKDAPNASAAAYDHRFRVKVGLFPLGNSQARLQNQPVNGLIEENLAIHNALPNQVNVLSGDVLNVNLDRARSHVVESYTEWMDPQTGRKKAFICKHLLLNNQDQDQFEHILDNSQNLHQVDQNIRLGKGNGWGFADIDPDDLF